MFKLFHRKDSVPKKFADAHHYYELVKSQKCPICQTSDSLRALKVEVGNKGWEVEVHCHQCNSHGLLNNTGFQIQPAYKEAPKK